MQLATIGSTFQGWRLLFPLQFRVQPTNKQTRIDIDEFSGGNEGRKAFLALEGGKERCEGNDEIICDQMQSEFAGDSWCHLAGDALGQACVGAGDLLPALSLELLKPLLALVHRPYPAKLFKACIGNVYASR